MKNQKIGPIYFDKNKSGYWLGMDDETFLPLGSGDLDMHLRAHGFLRDSWTNGLRETEIPLYEAQKQRSVDYAGPLSGHDCGSFRTSANALVLVTQATRPIKAKKGKFPHVEQMFGDLFGEQLPYFLGWLKVAISSLKRHDFAPGQAVVFAGASGCGKSFLQQIITELLGGRAEKPYRYLVGETSFNAELATAEHLVIGDEPASTDIRSRRRFGSNLKQFVAETMLSIHGKGRQAITLPTFRRVTISVNDEPENLMVLPPMDASLMDKISLFKCGHARLSEDRLVNQKRIFPELPALVAELEQWPIPKAMKDPRFGVLSYQNPELFEALSELSPETRLLSIIDEMLWKKDGKDVGPWKGSSEMLERELRSSAFAFAVDKLLNFSSACGTYMARLATQHPQRVTFTNSRGKRTWEIWHPQ
jgi:hypothetical protein